MKDYDFAGWATRNDLLCSDGRTIRRDAFKDCDGKQVPIVWNHDHNNPDNVLGHGVLENRPEGVWMYGKFNKSQRGLSAKEAVENGDVTALSIWANKLRHSENRDVLYGDIKEVSLVLAGANPGAFIEDIVAHGEDDEEAYIYANDFEPLELSHTDIENLEPTMEETLTHKEESKDSDEVKDDESDDETIADVLNTLSDKQKIAVMVMLENMTDNQISKAINQNDEISEGGNSMKHNVFEAQATENEEVTVLSHAEEMEIISDMKKHGSLRESYLAHVDGADTAFPTYTMGDNTYNYGIANIGYLFPENKELNSGAPEFIKKPDAWVSSVMNGVHRSPFARVKTTFADVTMDEARALGYKVKGQYKHEEAFRLMKRTTDPTTIYKKQKLDRDDVVDITGFDVIAWIRGEMRMKLDEEIARAILIGDGRAASSDDKIDELKVRPIWTDEDFFTIKEAVNVAADADEDAVARAFIRKAIKARKNYRGSGNCTLFTTEDMLTDMLLLEDLNGRIIYDSEAKLCSALRVKNIVTVPDMENKVRNVDGVDRPLMGIIVNMNDYNVGADKGGAVNMFDDFDIDYNQQKYLIETRISGALTKYHSAIVLEKVTASAAG